MHLAAWSALPLIALLASSLTGAWALLRNPRNPVNVAFGLWMAFFAIWNLGEIGILTSAGAEAALFWSKAQYIGIFLLPPSYAYFAFRLIGKGFNRALLFSPFVVFSALLPTDLFVRGVVHDSLHYAKTLGALYPLFSISALLLISYALYVLWRARKQVPGSAAKARLTLLMLPPVIPYLAIPAKLFIPSAELAGTAVDMLSALMALVIAYALVLKK